MSAKFNCEIAVIGIDISIGRVRSCVRPVCAARMAAGPNALRGSGPNRNHAFEDALTLAGSPDPRNDRVCITSSCPRQFVMTSLPGLCGRQQAWFLEALAPHHHGPGHASDLVGKRDGGDLGRPALHESGEPGIVLNESEELRAAAFDVRRDRQATLGSASGRCTQFHACRFADPNRVTNARLSAGRNTCGIWQLETDIVVNRRATTMLSDPFSG